MKTILGYKIIKIEDIEKLKETIKDLEDSVSYFRDESNKIRYNHKVLLLRYTGKKLYGVETLTDVKIKEIQTSLIGPEGENLTTIII